MVRSIARPIASLVAALAALAAATALLTGCVAPRPANWWVDVRYVDLDAGSCLAGSYVDDDELQTDEINLNAEYFRAVDCARPHRAQVVGVVEIPASSQWDDFGTAQGPSLDEASDWLDAACLAYGALVENYLERAGIPRSLEVSPSYGVLGDPVLGTCIAHAADFAEIPAGGIDIDGMLAGVDEGFDAELRGTADDWLADPLEGPVSTFWATLDPFTCVAAYPGPDEEYYDTVACALPHVAQFLGWVRMPDDWRSYRSDEEEAAIVTERCEQIRVAIAEAPGSPVPDIVVDSSTVGASVVIYGRNLAQCWAHLPDLAELPGDLRNFAQPPAPETPGSEAPASEAETS
jgi:hypothetical protein